MNQGQQQPQGQPGNRRRRRRRGGRTGGSQQPNGGGQANAQPSNQQSQPQHRQPTHNGHTGEHRGGQKQGGGGFGGGGRRRRRGAGGGGGGGQGKRQFTGPMDHLYRQGEPNGNVAGPRNQMGRNGNGNGNFGSLDMVPLPAQTDDALPKIFCFIDDLFFVAKIREISKALNIKLEFVKTDKEVLDRFKETEEKPQLLIFDLNSNGIKTLTLIPKMRSKFKKGTSIIGFVSHVQGDLKMKAIEAGCDTVMPRSAFSQNLPNLLRRHAVEEEEDEVSFNQ